LVDRMWDVREGATVDLGGDAVFEVLPAVIRDLRTSLWGYERSRRVLFPGDGFGYMHIHGADQCGRTAEEVPDR
jgi:flavorubredoxin